MTVATGSIERESVELREIYVRTIDEDLVLADPRGETVDVAFPPRGSRPDTWFAAAWLDGDPVSSPIGIAYRAQVEVGGPSTGAAIELDPGVWRVFIRPGGRVLDAGLLEVE